jgi:seryl-tRNA synthetase
MSTNGQKMSIADKIELLDKRSTTLRERLIELSSLRRANAVAATEDDQRALQSLMAADAECNRIQAELTMLDDAKGELELKAQKEAQAATAKMRELNAAEAKKLAADIAALNDQTDQAMIQLRQILDQRLALLVQLDRLKIITVPQRYMGKFNITAAAHACGLGKYLSLEHLPINHHAQLAESARLALPPSAEPPKPGILARFRPKPTATKSQYIG